ncbi:MAG: helix-turn-helix transcriptional regulator [Lachnospiraceae bacterium]|nr:helix-turn-helix transcriptional regulator [Lachnospiraceae bacterium]
MEYSDQFCSLEPEAPDACISGLLCILRADKICLNEGEMYAFPERQGCWYLFALEKGNVQMTHNGGHVNLKKGNAAAFSAGESVTVFPSAGGILYMLCLQGSVADTLFPAAAKKGGLFFPSGGYRVTVLFASLLAQWEHQRKISGETASAAAYEMLTGLYGTGVPSGDSRKQMPQVVADAIRIMQQDFAFLDGIGDLADRLDVSQEYLTRTFGKNVGLPPGKYLNQLKIEYAKLLLRQGNHSVSFVADACGFANGNYFAKVFKNVTGLSPAQYMKNYKDQAAGEDPMLDPFYVL